MIICLYTSLWFQVTKITILCKQLQLLVNILYRNNFPTVIWFQVFLTNTNNFQTDLFDSLMRPLQVLPLRVRVDLGVMTMK